MLGSFNPAIFQPLWLGTQGLIRPEEAKSAKIAIIQNEIADFVLGEWLHLQAVNSRFMIAATDPAHYGPLRDLAVGILAVLPHTPVSALGLNRMFHFRMPSVGAWHEVGNRLAPKDLWNPILEVPGLRSMTMQGRRKEAQGGTVNLKVEPSTIIEHGLYVEINEEFRPVPDTTEGTQWIVDCINTHWDATMKFAEGATGHLVGLVRK